MKFLTYNYEFPWILDYFGANKRPIQTIRIRVQDRIDFEIFTQAVNFFLKRHPLFFLELSKKTASYTIHPFTSYTPHYTVLDENQDIEKFLDSVFTQFNHDFTCLNQFPQIEIKVFRISKNSHEIFIKISQFTLDTFSVILMTEEILNIYSDFQKKIEIDEQNLNRDFLEYAETYEHKANEFFLKQSDAYRQYLNSYQSLKFPAHDLDLKKNALFSSTLLSKDLISAFKQQCLSAGANPWKTLEIIIAFAIIHTVSEQTSCSIHTISYGRENTEELKVIGNFSTTYFYNLNIGHQTLIECLENRDKHALFDSLPAGIAFTISENRNNFIMNAISKLLSYKIKKFISPKFRQIRTDHYAHILANFFWQQYLQRSPKIGHILINLINAKPFQPKNDGLPWTLNLEKNVLENMHPEKDLVTRIYGAPDIDGSFLILLQSYFKKSIEEKILQMIPEIINLFLENPSITTLEIKQKLNLT